MNYHRPVPKKPKTNSEYQLEHLPVVQVFHWKSRSKPALEKGELVYYGPFPTSYGIGEVQNVTKGLVSVDFRGTGSARVHEDVIHERYLVPLKEAAL
ncbi:MAG: DUF3553 domain-containing protein [Rhodothermaceae bacterium]|nr:DUF3553 domain-containing protein [Rhodothermaceae bacterium]MXW31808.1 DUF3553 domain-containing protein [Rhodothermaceae bacterium]MYC03333.1 DUF3553 domain-containing protein [Rhodothermaceae bacterium]MYE62986.1 DUF3553 domain-containing protein [Rhodothermaceae bacterium]MYI16491.1 DUF3553 domain-containing protein [Rhodothermaceae bacterium]